MGIISISETEDFPFPTRLLVAIGELAIKKGEKPSSWEGVLNLFYGSGNYIEIQELDYDQLVAFKQGLIFAIECLKAEGKFAGFEASAICPLLEKVLTRINH